MPLYRYTAKTVEGRQVSGQLEADDPRQLSTALHQKQLFLVRSKELTGDDSRVRLRAPELADFCRQLGTMLSSGISLVRAVDIILHRDVKPRVRQVYSQLYRSLQQGVPMSEARRQQRGAFPPLMISMFYAGESSGQLDTVATKMAAHFEKEHKLHTKIRGATIYPIILLCVTVLVMLAIFLFVLPQFFTLFEDMDTLPGPTRVVLAISNGLQNHWAAVLITVLVLVGSFAILLTSPQIHTWLDRQKLRLPVVGKLLRIIYTARFSRTLCSLYTSGLSMISALQISRTTVGNRYIDAQFDQVVELVRSGTPLSRAIQVVDGFDSKLSSTILIGEATGRLDDMLGSVADSFDYEAEMATQRLTTFIEPVLIIFMALVIGFIMISVMMPIYQLYGTIG